MTHNFFASSIGKKMVMAITGLILFGFVVIHMLGNLQIFLGAEALNAYAEELQSLPHFLWPARAVLLTALIVHIVVACALTIENRRARMQPYAFKDTVQASYASRTMMMSGLIIFFFIIYHLLHFTFGVAHPEVFHLTDVKGRHDVYSMVVMSFQNIFIASAYILAMMLLALHLSHGVQSLFQSLGFNHPQYTPRLKKIGVGVALAIFVGNSSIPIAVLLNLLRLPGRV